MRNMLFCVVTLAVACSGAEDTAPKVDDVANSKCPKVHIDKLSGDWILVREHVGDHKTRMEIFAKGDAYNAYYVDGTWAHMELAGEKRGENEIMFTEIPTGEKKKYYESGDANLVRLFVEPTLACCCLSVYRGIVTKDGKEQIAPKPIEFLEFPASEAVFSFRPSTEPLFMEGAAKDKVTADDELKKLGEPKPNVTSSKELPAGTWSSVEADGDLSCAYDMDVFFDDQRADHGAKVPAKEVKEGFRHWYFEFDAPYEDNHHFQFFRYRTCDGGERELIGVAGIEAILE